MDPNETRDYQRLSLMVQHIHHQDQLFWGRVQVLYFVQGAAIAGSYHARGEWGSWALLLLAVVLTAVLGLVCCYDWKDRTVNYESFHALADRRGVHFGALHTGPRTFLRGNVALMLTLLLFTWIDVYLSFAYFLQWQKCVAGTDLTTLGVLLGTGIFVLLTIGSGSFADYWRQQARSPSQRQP